MTKPTTEKKVKATKEKKESSAFVRKWPTGVTQTAKQLAAFAKKHFPKPKADEKMPTRMEVIRACIEEENNFEAQAIADLMEIIFGNNDWGKVEADSARRREFRNLANPKTKNPRGRPQKTDEEKAEAKAKAKEDKKTKTAKAKADKAEAKK